MQDYFSSVDLHKFILTVSGFQIRNSERLQAVLIVNCMKLFSVCRRAVLERNIECVCVHIKPL